MSHINPDFARDAAKLSREWGIVMPHAVDWMPDQFRHDFQGAMDALPATLTAPNAGLPYFYTAFVDPEVIRVFQTPNKGAEIQGEEKKGSWIDETAFFQVVENTGYVSSYGDFNTAGRSDANMEFVQRQSYLFQTTIEWGELEEERAGAAKLNWAAEKQTSAAKTLDKFMDYTYHFGVSGMQNYGTLNDPQLSPAMTPGTKAYGNGTGVRWVTSGQVTAQANEVYNDFLALYSEMVAQAPGLVDENTEFTFVYPNTVAGAMAATNIYGVTVRGLIKESFPNVRMVVDPRYNTAAGNVVQLIATKLDGKKTGFCAFNEKQRDHKLIPDLSSYKQKKTAGTWGAINRYPMAYVSMIGV